MIEGKPPEESLRKPFLGLLAIWLVLILIMAAAGGGYAVGRISSRGNQSEFTPLWQVWDAIHTQYVDQPVDDTKIIQGAIDGMMRSLGDEQSSYMDPALFELVNTSLEGYEGIGAEVDTSGSYLKIINPYPGSPAEAAGLKPGDEVIRLNGEDMTGVNPEKVRQQVLGPSGTNVKLSIRREGEAGLLEFDITRGRIMLPSVEGEMLPEGIAYIRIFVFAEDTGRLLKSTLEDLQAQHPKGLILDLRGNPGGLVDSAVEVGSQILPGDKLLVVEKYGNGYERKEMTKAGGLATEIPLVILVDNNSASSSEIIAGAVQDYDRGTLVGQQTYGKGSVQNWIELDNRQGAIRITVARWYTPSGRQISHQGLIPDIVISLSEADFQAGRDPQLEKAIELLL